jgi:hypothetical protein
MRTEEFGHSKNSNGLIGNRIFDILPCGAVPPLAPINGSTEVKKKKRKYGMHFLAGVTPP